MTIVVGVLAASCGGGPDAADSPFVTATGPAAAPADVAAACSALARSKNDLALPAGNGRWVVGDRLRGAHGLAEAAKWYDGRFSALEAATAAVAYDVRSFDDAGLATTVPAALDVCAALGTATDDRAGASVDAAAGCAAAARTRDQFANTDHGIFGNSILAIGHRVNGAMWLFAAASETDRRYQTLNQLTESVESAIVRFDLDRLNVDGAALLAACEREGLPH